MQSFVFAIMARLMRSGLFYRQVVRPRLFAIEDAEEAHEVVMDFARLLCHYEPALDAIARRFSVYDARLGQTVGGVWLPNPCGIAAGLIKTQFDTLPFWQALGVGFVEIGTVTRLYQLGKPRPRIRRFPKERALVNAMGFPNNGMEISRDGLHRVRPRMHIPVGVNIGPNAKTPKDRIVDDFTSAARELVYVADWLTVNVSSPNTAGLRDCQNEEVLARILEAVITTVHQECVRLDINQVPVWLKPSPDMEDDAVRGFVRVARNAGVRAVLPTNTTVSRKGLPESAAELEGGTSGRPLFERSLRVTEICAEEAGGDLDVIGIGGIRSHDDAHRMLRVAKAIMAYTGPVYEGPGMFSRILNGLVHDMDQVDAGSLREMFRRMA